MGGVPTAGYCAYDSRRMPGHQRVMLASGSNGACMMSHLP